MSEPSPAEPVGLVGALTFLGSLALSLAGILVHRTDVAIGAWAGGALSFANYLGLRALVAGLLRNGPAGGSRFRAWAWLRYGIIAVIFWSLVTLSVPCLLTALAVYAWSLGVLFWTTARRM